MALGFLHIGKQRLDGHGWYTFDHKSDQLGFYLQQVGERVTAWSLEILEIIAESPSDRTTEFLKMEQKTHWILWSLGCIV